MVKNMVTDIANEALNKKQAAEVAALQAEYQAYSKNTRELIKIEHNQVASL